MLPAGREIHASSPPPGRLSRWASPPWARATARTIERPRPEPPRARATSARAKRSKACGTEVRRQPGPFVRHVQFHRAVRGARGHAHRSAAVAEGVLDQVGEGLLDARPIRLDLEARVGLARQDATRGRGPPREPRHDGLQQRVGRQRLGLHGQASLIRAGDHQQVLRQAHQPVGLLAGGGDRRAQLARRVVAAQRQLQLGLEDRERRAELVAGVGHEGPLVREGGVGALEQLVEGQAEPADLVVGGRQGQAVALAGARDPLGAGAHRLHGPQRRRRDAVSGGRGEDQGDRPGDQQEGGEVADGVVAVAQSRADHHDGARHVPVNRHGEQPRALVQPRDLRHVDEHGAVLGGRHLRGREQLCRPQQRRGIEDRPRGAEHLGEGRAPLGEGALAGLGTQRVAVLGQRAHVGGPRAQRLADRLVEVVAEADPDHQCAGHQHDRHHHGEREGEPDPYREAVEHPPSARRRYPAPRTVSIDSTSNGRSTFSRR